MVSPASRFMLSGSVTCDDELKPGELVNVADDDVNKVCSS